MASNEGVLEVEQFLNGSLYKWFKTCIDRFDLPLDTTQDLSYELLIDGVHMHSLFCKLGIAESDQFFYMNPFNQNQRYVNLKTIIRNIDKNLKIDLKQVVLREPNIEKLILEPKLNVREMENLLYLVYSCVEPKINYDMLSMVLKKFNSKNCIEISQCSRKVIQRPELVLDINMFKDNENGQEIISRITDCMLEMKSELECHRMYKYYKTVDAEKSFVGFGQETMYYRTKAHDFYSQQKEEIMHLENLNDVNDSLKSTLKNLKACKRVCEKSIKAIVDSKKCVKAELANLDDEKNCIGDETTEKISIPEVKNFASNDNLRKKPTVYDNLLKNGPWRPFNQKELFHQNTIPNNPISLMSIPPPCEIQLMLRELQLQREIRQMNLKTDDKSDNKMQIELERLKDENELFEKIAGTMHTLKLSYLDSEQEERKKNKNFRVMLGLPPLELSNESKNVISLRKDK